MAPATQPTWLFLEDRSVIVDPDRGIVAAVRGDRYTGYVLAASHRLFDALDHLETIAGEIAGATSDGQGVAPGLLDDLEVARGEAALALRLASGAREH